VGGAGRGLGASEQRMTVAEAVTASGKPVMVLHG
jgi:hypothetical protein